MRRGLLDAGARANPHLCVRASRPCVRARQTTRGRCHRSALSGEHDSTRPSDSSTELQKDHTAAVQPFLTLSTGEALSLTPHRRAYLGPSFDFSREEALGKQLEALQHNNEPHVDHGVEVLYRFADIDVFTRSAYFGRRQDLGQWERFRRVMHSGAFKPLLEHTRCSVLSSLEVGERVWKQRVAVVGSTGSEEEHVYELTMTQRLGGFYDGIWFCSSLLSSDADEDVTRKT